MQQPEDVLTAWYAETGGHGQSPQKGRPEPPSSGPCYAGAMIAGRYRAGEVIGGGGASTVWSVYDTRLSRWVAAKLSVGPAAALAVHEAHLQATCQHPNLMPLHDAGQDSLLGVSYIVMPLYPGADLASVLMRYGPLPFRSARQCVDQVCSALDYLQRRTHAAHGDVKPSNIWLTGSGAALLMDFHLYGVMARGMGRAGTPGYSAPEALRGCQDPRSDVFSAGCVLYEALTGKMAFADDAAVLAGRCIPVDQVRRDIRPDLAAVLSKAMAADPERRYQSPREMQTAVRYPGRGAGVSVLSLMARDTDRLVAWAWRCVIAILGFAGRSGSRFVRRMVRRPVQALVEAAVVGSLTYWAYGQALQWLTVHPHFLRSIGWGVVAALAVAAIIRIAAASRLAMRRR